MLWGRRCTKYLLDGLHSLIRIVFRSSTKSRTGRCTVVLKIATEVEQVAWSPDGLRLAAMGSDGIATIWDASAGYAAQGDGAR